MANRNKTRRFHDHKPADQTHVFRNNTGACHRCGHRREWIYVLKLRCLKQ